MFRPLGVIIRSSLRTYYLPDVNNRFLSSTWWWPPRVETCYNFKPTIKVVLTEIYMLFIIDLMIPHNGMNSINISVRFAARVDPHWCRFSSAHHETLLSSARAGSDMFLRSLRGSRRHDTRLPTHERHASNWRITARDPCARSAPSCPNLNVAASINPLSYNTSLTL